MKNRTEVTARFLAAQECIHRAPAIPSKVEVETFVEKTWGEHVSRARALVKLIETSPPEPFSLPAGQKEYLREMAMVLKSKLPDNYGFIVLALPIGEPNGTDRVTYLSTLERTGAIAAVKEWLLKCGAVEDWLKHIT